MMPHSRLLALTVALIASATAHSAMAQAAPGEAIFRQRCGACHVLTPGGAPGPLAPNLRGVVGRKAGTTAFKTYSPALKAAGPVWTKPNLDKFLTAPTRMVPGTRMVMTVPDPAQRAQLIAFLASQR